MPGAGNVPQPMHYDPAREWFIAEGVPVTPLDDAAKPNSYPLMRLEARTTAGTLLATSDVVLPVSDEMDCRICHSSGAGDAAKPAGIKVEQAPPPAPKAYAKPMKTVAAGSKRVVHMFDDARHCLDLPTIAEIVKCAEPFRY